MAPQSPTMPRVVAVPRLETDELQALGGGALLENFQFYAGYSSPGTELFWAKALDGEQLVGAAPVVRLRKRKATDMLKKPLRRWLGPVLGPLARKTTLLVDTAFLAYDDCSPFFCAPGADRLSVKQTISTFLKSQKRVDTVWISEPPADADWAASEGYRQFHTLPMVHVELEGFHTLEDYAASLSKKRRRNFRTERDAFAGGGAMIEKHAGPLGKQPDLLEQLLLCLRASAAHSQLTVPYNDVLTDPRAFAAQPQTALVARAGGRVVGFMSFLRDGDRLMQCHGGLDYDRSHEVMAYHNLIYAAIEHAIRSRCRLMSMGPLNNETKRRAGSALRPIIASLWNKNPIDDLVARKLFVKNFEVYQGELGVEPAA